MSHPSQTSPDVARIVRWPLAISFVATLAILTIAATMIFDLRSEVGARARQTSENLLRLIERDIARNVEMLDLSLQASVDGVARADVMATEPELRRLILFDRSSTASGVGVFGIFDAQGRPVIEAVEQPPRPERTVQGRDYFEAQREPGRGLYIGRPHLSQVLGKDVVGLSRRIPDVAGGFGGVAVVTLQVSYFIDLLTKLQLGTNGIVSLVRADGALMVRHGGSRTQTLEDLSKSPVFQRLQATRSGTFVGASAVDGIERLYTFTRIGELPLILSVGLATGDIYADWFEKALLLGAILLTICLVIIAFTAVLTRELRRRGLAEAELVQTNAELARLSITDSLTELGNRRLFDESLAREIRRAARTRRDVTLIILDVDDFKKFNDRYGHQEGDRVLQDLAGVLREALHRSGDTAFRVGGEEFAIILPETALAGGVRVAEEIRSAMHRLARPHADTGRGIVTLSLGIADAADNAASAYARADAALYEAKRSGRDRVSVSRRRQAAA